MASRGSHPFGAKANKKKGSKSALDSGKTSLQFFKKDPFELSDEVTFTKEELYRARGY